jgi:tetratricopeptide (TPR) repeat protein
MIVGRGPGPGPIIGRRDWTRVLFSTEVRLGHLITSAAAVAALAAPAAADAIARHLVEEGDALAARGDRGAALAKYEAALDADPDAADPYDRAMPLWLEVESIDTAARYLERGAARHPEWPQLWYSLAYIYRRQHKTDDALQAYAEYILLRPTDPAPYYGVAVLHDEAGTTAAAVAAYRRYRVLERDPTRADFRRQALRAIDRLAPWAPRWQDYTVRLLADGGGVDAWRTAAKLVAQP